MIHSVTLFMSVWRTTIFHGRYFPFTVTADVIRYSVNSDPFVIMEIVSNWGSIARHSNDYPCFFFNLRQDHKIFKHFMNLHVMRSEQNVLAGILSWIVNLVFSFLIKWRSEDPRVNSSHGTWMLGLVVELYSHSHRFRSNTSLFYSWIDK